MMKPIHIKDYTYDLPQEKIARQPLKERDVSKLLIYRDGEITTGIYKNLAAHIPAGSLMVFNQTKVVPARILFQKESGSTIEVFCLEPHPSYGGMAAAMQQKQQVMWQCMVGGASKWKKDLVLYKKIDDTLLAATIISREEDGFLISFSWDDVSYSFAEILEKAGVMPLPPYMKRAAGKADYERYQTVYAKDKGSVAAPTAGLHFTKDVLSSLSPKNIDVATLTLHVGAGTFQPVKTATVQEHAMHAEWMEINIATLDKIISTTGQEIIAVGTTSLRSMESMYWMGLQLLSGQLPDFKNIAVPQWRPYENNRTDISAKDALQALKDWMLQNGHEKIITKTQIIIVPGYRFKIATGLITNFHQPQSTLLLLVAAFVGDDWKKIYNYALENDFRFLSYGDGSLLWKMGIKH